MWEHDRLVRGLSEIPQCIMFQVRRFNVHANGNIAKLSTPVAMPELTLQLPAGECPSNLVRVTYRVVAAVAHYGATPDTGHYRAFLVGFEGCWHVTDDNTRSCVATPNES